MTQRKWNLNTVSPQLVFDEACWCTAEPMNTVFHTPISIEQIVDEVWFDAKVWTTFVFRLNDNLQLKSAKIQRCDIITPMTAHTTESQWDPSDVDHLCCANWASCGNHSIVNRQK